MKINRRGFIGSAAAAALLAARQVAAKQAQEPPEPPEPSRPRLLALELQCGAPLAAMKAFYGKTLDLGIRKEEADRITVDAGETKLTFIGSKDADPASSPFYHFAFNVPENKIREALAWQKARTPVLTIPEPHRGSGYPPEVAYDRQANAHSIFFNDPAGNVVEYIARHDLKNGGAGAFGWSDLLHVSEIALIVDDVAGTAVKLAAATSLSPREGSTADVAAIGDDWGQIVVMKRGRPFDFSPSPQRGAGVYHTGITLRAAEPSKYEVPGYPYQVALEWRCSCE